MRLSACAFLLAAWTFPAAPAHSNDEVPREGEPITIIADMLRFGGDDFPLEGGAIIIEDGRVQPMPGDEIHVTGNVRIGPDPLPTDEELARVRISEQLLALVERLNHEDYAEREAALKAIVDLPGDNMPIYALLSRNTLGPEQHFRLMSAVRERLVHAPRGALGISMALDRPEVVEITDLIPGLPAEKVLQIGDRIVAIDERPIENRGELTMMIQSRRPGDRVALTILRTQRDGAGRPLVDEEGRLRRDILEVEVELGSVDRLRDPITGRVQLNPMVVQQRQREANAVERRFRLEPKRLQLAGEIPIPPRSAGSSRR